MAKSVKVDKGLLGKYLDECISRDLVRLKTSKLKHHEFVRQHLLISNAMLFIEGGGS